jgi:hypothetical protein
MLIMITADPASAGGCWLRLRCDIPRIFCSDRATALRVLEENFFGARFAPVRD